MPKTEKKTDETRRRVVELLSEELGISEAEITDDSHIADDLGADSLDCVEVVMACEERFNIMIDDEEAENVKTVGALVDAVKSKLAAKTAAAD